MNPRHRRRVSPATPVARAISATAVIAAADAGAVAREDIAAKTVVLAINKRAPKADSRSKVARIVASHAARANMAASAAGVAVAAADVIAARAAVEAVAAIAVRDRKASKAAAQSDRHNRLRRGATIRRPYFISTPRDPAPLTLRRFQSEKHLTAKSAKTAETRPLLFAVNWICIRLGFAALSFLRLVEPVSLESLIEP